MKIPKKLVEAIRNGELVVFAGAGFSKKLSLPTWDAFAKEVMNNMSEVSNARGKSAVDRLSNIDQAERPQVRKYIYEKFRLPVGKQCRRHEMIFQITNKIVTTNYDNAFETAYENIYGGSRPTLILPFDETLMLIADDIHEMSKHEQSFIFKFHGCAAIPDSCIVFNEDYARLYSETEGAAPKHFAEEIARRYTILFIGFSFKDERFKKLMDGICRGKQFAKKHYIIVKEDEVKKYADYQYLSCIPVKDYYKPFDILLEKLILGKNESLSDNEKIRNITIFNGLSNDSIKIINEIPLTILKSSDTLSKPKGKTNSFWAILDGKIEVKTVDNEIIKKGTNEIVGEIGFVLGQRENTIRCTKDNTKLIEITKGTIKKLSFRDQNILWQNIVYELYGKRIQSSANNMSWEKVAKGISKDIRNRKG